MSDYWERKGVGGRARVRSSRRGWIVERESRWQGERTGTMILVPFDYVGMPAGAKLADTINEHGTTWAEAIVVGLDEDRRDDLLMGNCQEWRALHGKSIYKVLRAGHVVR